MKIEIKDNTAQAKLMISDLPDKLYITNKLWIATPYGVVRIGIEGGDVYELIEEELRKTIEVRGKAIGSN